MSNPFEELQASDGDQEINDFELVGGAFTCQIAGCWKVVNEAKYFADAKLLTWKCPDDHISKITGFNL